MSQNLEQYFSDYAAAFNAFDVERLATFFYCPCLMVSADAVAPLVTEEAIRTNLTELLRYHERQGVGRASAAEIDVRLLGGHLAVVTVRWSIARSDGSQFWGFSNTYNLVDHGAGWKVLVSTTHEAST